MTRERWAVLVAFSALFTMLGLFGPRAGAAAASTGAIDGQLVVKSGTAPASGVQVRLQIGAGGASPEERRVTTGADGAFRFDNVPLLASAVYLVHVTFDGGAYFREVTFQPDATTATTGPIDVYAATKDDASVSFARLRMLVTMVGANGLQIVETGAFVNPGPSAYIGSGAVPAGASLRFQVPLGAISVAVATGLNRNTLVDAPGGFATLEAIVPGEHPFAYTYDMAASSSSLPIARNFVYRTELFQLYVPTAVSVSSPLLQDSGVSTLANGQRFRIYTARNLPAGATLTATVSNLPSGAGVVNPLYPAMAVFVLLIGVGLLVAYGRRSRPALMGPAAPDGARAPALVTRPDQRGGMPSSKPAAEVPGHISASGELIARRRQLLLDLAELDDRHTAGELADDVYQQLRNDRKRELTTILVASGSSATPSR